MTRTADHQMTPEHDTSTPAEDHPSTSTTKITEPITPWHHDPREIHFSVAAAPSVLILPAAVAVAVPAVGGLTGAGASC